MRLQVLLEVSPKVMKVATVRITLQQEIETRATRDLPHLKTFQLWRGGVQIFNRHFKPRGEPNCFATGRVVRLRFNKPASLEPQLVVVGFAQVVGLHQRPKTRAVELERSGHSHPPSSAVVPRRNDSY